jgi:hypothetical protein
LGSMAAGDVEIIFSKLTWREFPQLVRRTNTTFVVYPVTG